MNLQIYCLSTSTYSGDIPALHGVEHAISELIPVLEKNGLVHSCSNKASTDVTNDFLSFVKGLDKADDQVILFYFCGHGFLTGNNLDCLLLGTTDTSYTNYTAKVGIDCQWVLDTLKNNGIEKYVIVLDCCHSALMSNMGGPINTSHILNNGGAVLTATSKTTHTAKQAKIDEKDYAVFTYCFTKVLKMGIGNGKKTISLIEMYREISTMIETSEYSGYLDLPQIKSINGLDSIPLFKNEKSPMFWEPGTSHEPIKVLLVKTAIDFPIKDYDFGVPLGLWLLKSYITLQGINVIIDIYDERLDLRCNKSTDFRDIIHDYDMVGVSICSCEVPQALKKLQTAKGLRKITFVGGIFCSSNEKYLLDCDCIDYVIPGVGTLPLLNLLKELIKNRSQGNDSLVHHVYGVITKENVTNLKVWKPSQLPYIELKIWKQIVEQYFPYLEKKIDIFTTRGCNQRCNFCSVQKECQQKIYQRDEASIEEEIDYLYSKGFRRFSVKDEDFLLFGAQHLMPIFERCNRSHHDITFKIRARVDGMLREKVDLEHLYDIGIREIQYGLETPDSNLLVNVKKGYKYGQESLKNLIQRTTSCGITANCSFILGIYGESIDYYHSLLNFFEELQVDRSLLKIYVNFLTPHPYKNEFPKNEYSLVTNDLKYFTHKIPVCFPNGMRRMTRIEMLGTYDKIVKFYNMGNYNPPINETIRTNFINGNRVKMTIPTYKKEAN